MIVANLGGEPRQLSLPSSMRGMIMDRLQPSPNWLRRAPRNQVAALDLPAFSVAFLMTGPDDIFEAEQ